MAELEAREQEARKIAENARNEVEKTEFAKKKAEQDLENTQKLLKETGKKVDQSLEEFKNAAGSEGATMETLEKEMMEKMTLKAELEEKAFQERQAKAAAAKPEQKEEPKPAQKAQPSEADIANQAKKASLQTKFNKIKDKVQASKDSAVEEVKKGGYAEAITLYKKAANILEIAYEDFGVFKKEIAQQEAAIFNNIAHCYGKDQHDKASIDYSTKVIERALYIDDIMVLIKAYLRRAAAYEHIERYKLAVDDLMRVRELQPYNKQAQTGITRCQKYIKQDEGTTYNPSRNDLNMPELPEIKKQAETVPEASPRQVQAPESPKAAPAKPAP